MFLISVTYLLLGTAFIWLRLCRHPWQQPLPEGDGPAPGQSRSLSGPGSTQWLRLTIVRLNKLQQCHREAITLHRHLKRGWVSGVKRRDIIHEAIYCWLLEASAVLESLAQTTVSLKKILFICNRNSHVADKVVEKKSVLTAHTRKRCAYLNICGIILHHIWPCMEDGVTLKKWTFTVTK